MQPSDFTWVIFDSLYQCQRAELMFHIQSSLKVKRYELDTV